ncbi:MAG: molybdenum cofactor guanylyltransferase [Ahniella sp.]|nr:molybdenum cofactor guanylyltransferase [Ahniella sp.]
MAKQNITGCILAGGRGLRMGGADKGLIAWQGKPMAQHMLERLAPQVSSVLIIANRNLDRYQTLGVPVVSDASPGFLGPIAGIRRALAQCTRPYLVTTPCDTPEFPLDLVTRLHAALDGSDAEVAVTRRRTTPVSVRDVPAKPWHR